MSIVGIKRKGAHSSNLQESGRKQLLTSNLVDLLHMEVTKLGAVPFFEIK